MYSGAQQFMQNMVVRFQGDGRTCTLRRLHSLRDQSPGGAPTTLLVNGAQLAGASTLSLKGGAALTGVLVTGCKFTIAGNVTVYTTLMPTAAGAGGTLVVIPISPVLAANAGNLAVVTITQPYGDHTFAFCRGANQADDMEGAVRGRRRVLHLSATGATTVPEQGDLIVEDGLTISRVDTSNPGAGAARYSIVIGEMQ